jgi:membrane-associated protease RseP (regulator of RpoE activity)
LTLRKSRAVEENFMLMTLGILVVLFIIGGVFFHGGLEAKRKPPYPYRWVDMGWQFGLGGLALSFAALVTLSLLRRAFAALLG